MADVNDWHKVNLARCLNVLSANRISWTCI